MGGRNNNQLTNFENKKNGPRGPSVNELGNLSRRVRYTAQQITSQPGRPVDEIRVA